MNNLPNEIIDNVLNSLTDVEDLKSSRLVSTLFAQVQRDRMIQVKHDAEDYETFCHYSGLHEIQLSKFYLDGYLRHRIRYNLP